MTTRITLVSILLVFFLPVTTFALSGDTSGTWTLADSPITIDGDTTISEGSTLTISPGVVIQFTGPYKLIIKGMLSAVGTTEDPIIFTRAEATDESRWGGIRFTDSDDNSIIEHCIIEYVYNESDEYQEVWGGGVHISNCSPTIRHSTIRYNSCRNTNRNGAGGAIFVYGESTSIIESNHLHNNISDSGGAIFIGGESWPKIRRNLIENNTAHSSGGGIYVAAWSEATIEANTIKNNNAFYWGGGGITLWNNTCSTGLCTEVINNAIYNNSAHVENGYGFGNGGGIYCRYNRSYQFNNTIYGNSADGLGGGLYVLNQGNTYPTIINTIIRQNVAPEGPQVALVEMTGSTGNPLYSEAEIYNSNIEGGWTGTGSGNIDEQPVFANPVMGQFLLLPGSAGVDAGDSSLSQLPATDILGNNRFSDGDANGSADIDMGAFELDPSIDIPADIDDSQSITLADTVLLLQLVSGLDVGLTADRTGIDVNQDNKIGLAEALYCLQHLAQ